mmetsp:Transcript_39814/g.40599  ORF Transcript_39814/g.40599 Transcript_39814/m.40599 type:complete len:171 (+) Transcript_39814:128-640(+)
MAASKSLREKNLELKERLAADAKKRSGSYYRDIEYADDEEMYMGQISREEKLEYLAELRANPSNRTVPSDQVLWVDENRTNAYQMTLSQYPPIRVLLLRLTTHVIWDYLYLLSLSLSLLGALPVWMGLKISRLPPPRESVGRLLGQLRQSDAVASARTMTPSSSSVMCPL